MSNKIVYLDNNATTRVAPEVLEEMLPYFSKFYGNPSSMYHFGKNVRKKIVEAREKAADFLGAEPDEIIFTSGGTESDNTAIHSAVKCHPEKKHIITTCVEHPAVLNTVQHLETQGFQVTKISVDNKGNLDLDELQESLTDDTLLVSVMYANNEIGNIYPIEKIGEIVKAAGVMFHTDAVQVAGKIPLKMHDSTIDMLSLSGHKFHGPKGIGVLYVKKSTDFLPLIMGGHQEQDRRSGTENTASIIGIGKAAELAKYNIDNENSRVKELRDRLENTILNTIPDSYVNGNVNNRLPNTSNISFAGVKGEAVLLLLEQQNICVSTGSACSTGSLDPSHVLLAMRIPAPHLSSAIRFSLGKYNVDEDVEYLLKFLPQIVQNLKRLPSF